MNTQHNMHIHPQLERAAAMDMHQRTIVVCFYQAGQPEVIREYGTFTCDLEKIRDDLKQAGIQDALMESTGIYWIALCSLLMGCGINVRVVNPRFVKNMPKEKTDRKDARWLCKLLVNGMVRNSFIVSEQQRAFRDLCRQRTKYTQHITQAQNRLLKNLERRNIKLRSVVSSVNTQSAMSIIRAIASGEQDVEKLISLCKGRLKNKQQEMRKALVGVITQHDRDMLAALLRDIDHYQSQIESIEEKIRQHTDGINQELITDLQEIKGVAQKSTEIILAEIGDNVDAFANGDKLAAWVGVAPGQNNSSDKNKYAGTREGNQHLRTTIIQVAWGAVRTKNSYWRALFAYLIKHMPAKKAIVAIARKLVRIIYKIIKRTKTYTEYGADYFIEKLLQRKSNASRA